MNVLRFMSPPCQFYNNGLININLIVTKIPVQSFILGTQETQKQLNAKKHQYQTSSTKSNLPKQEKHPFGDLSVPFMASNGLVANPKKTTLIFLNRKAKMEQITIMGKIRSHKKNLPNCQECLWMTINPGKHTLQELVASSQISTKDYTK